MSGEKTARARKPGPAPPVVANRKGKEPQGSADASTRLSHWADELADGPVRGFFPGLPTPHGELQATGLVSPPSDPLEQEADRAAERATHMLSLNGTDVAQERSRADVARVQPLTRTQPRVQRAPADAVGGPVPAGGETPLPSDASIPETATPSNTNVPGLIVEDDVASVTADQMRKSEFLSRLRDAVCTTAEDALAGTIYSAIGCPWIDRWFAYYQGQDSVHIERALRRYAPETARATSAQESIPLICARVRQGIVAWSTTGEVPQEVPSGPPMPQMLDTGGSSATGVASAGESPASNGGSGATGAESVSALESAASSGGTIHYKRRNGSQGPIEAPRAIQAQLGGGRPLESNIKSQMTSAFGYDFSHVQVHTDATAARLSQSLNAHAFTVGEHVAFGAGEYQPGTPLGAALVAHELAHVIQQDAVRSSGTSPFQAEHPDSSLEEDADRSAVAVMASIHHDSAHTHARHGIIPRLRAGLGVQRCGSHGPAPSPPAVQRVEFVGGHAMTPHALDPKANPVWTPGASDHAAAYTKGTDPALNARFQIGASLSGGSIRSVSVRAKESGVVRGTKSGITPGAGTIDVTGLTVTGLTGSANIDKRNYSLDWEGSADGTNWIPLGRSGSHPIYWVYATPVASMLYSLAVSKATGYASGLSDAAAAAAAVRSGLRGVDGLAYDPADSINPDPLTVYADGVGICTDFGNLLTLLARSIGLNANTVMFWGGFESLGKNVWVTLGGSLINLVNVRSPNPAFNPPPTTISPAGWAFNYHVISRIGGVLQDAALDRQGIDADAVHAGKIVHLVELASSPLSAAIRRRPYNSAIPRRDHVVGVTLRDYGEKITPANFSSDIFAVSIPPGAPPTVEVPVSWAVRSGTLPAGLSLDPALGSISGTPTTAGTFPLGVEVTAFNGGVTLSGVFPVTLVVRRR